MFSVVSRAGVGLAGQGVKEPQETGCGPYNLRLDRGLHPGRLDLGSGLSGWI